MSTVLIVEDDGPLANWYTRILEFNGYTLAWATNCADAVDQVSQLCPDLILLDICLPDGDGFDVLKQVNSGQNGQLPNVVVVSSGDFKPQAEEFGVLSYLSKPVTMDKLLETVKTAIQ
jgi:DNA-binding response OmpR family regulator